MFSVKDILGHFGLGSSLTLALVTPDLVFKFLAGACSILGAINYCYSIREKKANLRKMENEPEKKEDPNAN